VGLAMLCVPSCFLEILVVTAIAFSIDSINQKAMDMKSPFALINQAKSLTIMIDQTRVKRSTRVFNRKTRLEKVDKK
jgi:hypothetical protein